MNTIEINLDETNFQFNNEEPTIVEERKIENVMIELLGGWEKASELDNAMTNSYRKHITAGREKYGREEFDKMQQRMFELKEEKSEESMGLSQKLNDNSHYQTYIRLLTLKVLTKNYAWMQVMCISPAGFNFLKQKEDYLLKIWAKVLEKKIPVMKKE